MCIIEIGGFLALHFFDRPTRILNHRGVPLGWYSAIAEFMMH
jgi:hypothetical protein